MVMLFVWVNVVELLPTTSSKGVNEEAPAFGISDDQRQAMMKLCVAAAKVLVTLVWNQFGSYDGKGFVSLNEYKNLN